jgi:hypothetical protein
MQKKKEKHIKVHIQYKRHVNTKELFKTTLPFPSYKIFYSKSELSIPYTYLQTFKLFSLYNISIIFNSTTQILNHTYLI